MDINHTQCPICKVYINEVLLPKHLRQCREIHKEDSGGSSILIIGIILVIILGILI